MIAVNQSLRPQIPQTRRFVLAKVGKCIFRSATGIDANQTSVSRRGSAAKELERAMGIEPT
jgi:hypothetical protein